MSPSSIILLAVALAMDALAVSVGLSLRFQWNSLRQFFRLSFHFGLFQFMMPILGWAAGTTVESYIRDFDHWVAFGLLAVIGARMLKGGSGDEQPFGGGDPTRGRWLVLLSVATSIDALAVGLSLSVMAVPILLPSVVIGIVAAGFTLFGMYFGNRLRVTNSRYLEIAGGLILIGIGAKILLEHTLLA
ncbi:MAG: manganese efflux pump [Candidatus Glassbacteria bacterium]|nr:manganese efflux pump [Candidatus Glassbacteria bacterium]